jgi:hypothetical protein
MTLPGFRTRPGGRPSPGLAAQRVPRCPDPDRPLGRFPISGARVTGSFVTATTQAVDGGWLAQ